MAKKKIKTEIDNFIKFDLSPIKKLITIMHIINNGKIYLFKLMLTK